MKSFHLPGKSMGDLNLTLSLSKWVLGSEMQVCFFLPCPLQPSQAAGLAGSGVLGGECFGLDRAGFSGMWL